MYPLPTNPSPSTSTSTPGPTSTFEPSFPQQLTENQNTESSPQSSLPCGQRTPAGSTSTSDTPSPHTPPQPFVHSQQQPQIPTPTHHQNPINHKTFNIHLLKRMLTRLLSLPFQMKNNSVYPNRQMVVR